MSEAYKIYNSNFETTDLLDILCKLGLGVSIDLAITDLNLRTAWIFGTLPYDEQTCSFITKISHVSILNKQALKKPS